ncbi:peptidoglycan-binding domain-containing protein [Streptomyces sparsogenes]|uniref:peptidoglycan-binding domain-containing protein n=1 Tax=Streptomyces sparsogenes TaxID=67365 RepID=UPI00332B6924
MAAGTEPAQPTGRQVIEPTRIFRAVVEPDRDGGPPLEAWMEELDLFRPGGAALPPGGYDIADADTQEFDPGPGRPAEPPPAAAPPAAPGRRGRPRAVVLTAAGAVGAALALALVLLLPGGDGSPAARPGPGGGAPAGGTSAPTAPTASTAPGGADGAREGGAVGGGPVLSLGDSGPEVSELQSRLLRIPDVYTGGAVNGRYDRTLASAVARFQLWYGIRGDEDGVYGDATRRDLESRT